MDNKEMESLVKQLKAAGLNDEMIMDTFFQTFQEGKMDRDDLEKCAEFLGYELTDEFKNDATPDPINAGGTEGDGITKEEAEQAKEIKPGENPEEFQEKIEGMADNKTDVENPKPEEQEKPADEDAEWEEVQKKFNW